MSIDSHTVPLLWKTSNIIPIPKNKSVKEMNDLRPISLTSILMKGLEKLVKNIVYEQVKDQLDCHQFAYLSGRGVDDAQITLLHYLQSHLDKPGTYARVLFVDFSSAFNTIQPHLLIKTLVNLNVNNNVILWIYSYLVDRKQCVQFKNEVSDYVVTNTGSPQGGVLSPFLFTLYTNKCHSTSQNVKIVKYADDTACAGLIKDSEFTYRSEVDAFVSWCKSNFLQINIKKTEEMIIDFKTKKSNINPLVINNEPIKIVSKYKYLGTTIDDKLKFECNVDMIYSKANKRLYFLRSLYKINIDKIILKLFYQSIVQSVITFV